MLTPSLKHVQGMNYSKHSYSFDALFQLVFVINFPASHTLLNVLNIFMKSEKDQRNILGIKKYLGFKD